uniref:Proteasome activator PA28 C-terminal domain-containing protein n=1 Tax=Pinguiococcus pyrenoidosus TaxID=172671 RepID=A0A7R9U5D0_9STRA
MDDVRTRCTIAATEALLKMGQSAEHVEAFLQSHYQFGTLAEAETAFANAKDASTNTSVTEALSLCKTVLAECLNCLAVVKRWVQLHVPQIEDGNNFGVQIQYEVTKSLTERAKELKTLLDELHKYPSERVALLKDVVPTASATSTNTTGHSESKGGEKDETKDTSSTSNEETVTTPSPLDDSVAAVAALDARWYYHTYYVLMECCTVQYTMIDVVAKNREKIEFPKGKSSSMYSM